MADYGYSIQVGDRQVLCSEQLLQHPDQSAKDTEVGCPAVGHQLVVTLKMFHFEWILYFTGISVQQICDTLTCVGEAASG